MLTSPRPPAFFLHSQCSPSSASVPHSAIFSSPKSSLLLNSVLPSGIGLSAPLLHVQCRCVNPSPNIEFEPGAFYVLFHELGLNEKEAECLVTRERGSRLKSIRSLRAYVASLKSVGIGAVTRTSCENMQRVIELFLSYGFSREDVLLMSKKHPQILQYNPDSLEEKLEYLVGDMGRDLDELLDFPAFLGYKLDCRIKGKIIGEGISLNRLLTFREIWKEGAKRAGAQSPKIIGLLHPQKVMAKLIEIVLSFSKLYEFLV